MNIRRILQLDLAITLFFGAGAQANNIEEGKEFYTAVKAKNPIVLDGDLSEWSGANVIADPRFWSPKANAREDQELVNFELWGGGNWTGPDDHTSAVRVVYDDENVYFGFVVTDEYHENSANSAWNGDSVQLMVANADRDTQIALYNYALGGVEDALGGIVILHEAGPGGTEAVVTRNAETKRTVYEIKLPKSALELDELTSGVQFGLGMAINDGDETTPGQKGWGGLGAHSIVHGKSPEQTALITLFEPPVFPEGNNIEEGKEHYTAIRAANPIVLDGKLDEWSGAQVVADPRFWSEKAEAREDQELVNFELWGGGNWTGPDDQTSAVRVVYDDENVYFGFVVTDEYHENSANSAWNGDSVQLMIANDTRDTQVALYNYALGGVEDALGEIIILHESGPGGTEAVVTRNTETKRTVYEIKLPKSALDIDELTGGVQFGLGMAINDGDKDTPGQKGWGGLGAHSIVHGKSPEETALVTLAASNNIESGKEFYFASPVTSPIALDGELNDWGGIGILSDPRFWSEKAEAREDQELVNFELWGGGNWTGPDDHTSAVQVAFDLDNVYFAIVVTDEYHENSANSAWNGDSVQLMIANDKQDTQIALYNYALGGVEDALGEIVILHEAGPGGTEAVIKRDSEAKRTTYEIKLPKASLGIDSLELGTQFGLGMAINDGDETTPGQKGWGGLGAHALVHGKSPNQTALVTLGIGGGSGCFLSAINSPTIASLDQFKFRANDFEGCKFDLERTTLLIDGQSVELVASERKQGAVDFTHTLAAPFATGSEHTFVIELRDSNGNVVGGDAGDFVSPRFGILTADMQVTSAGNPGFMWKVFLSEFPPGGDDILEETELALGGELGNAADNFADPELFGPAIGEGIVVGSLLEFEIPTVINLSMFEGDAKGNFELDDQMPGVPGVNGISDGASAEITMFIEFPTAGLVTLGVNSADGFRMEGGPHDQPEMRLTLGQEPNGRGASDSIFAVQVDEPGIYPIRVIWWNGGGDASIELFTVKEDGTKVLLNDVANGGLQTYSSALRAPFEITSITRDAAGEVTLVWNSSPGRDYALDYATSLDSEWLELDDTLPSQGASSEVVVNAATANSLSESGRLFFRIRKP
jgi:hypothetical protein